MDRLTIDVMQAVFSQLYDIIADDRELGERYGVILKLAHGPGREPLARDAELPARVKQELAEFVDILLTKHKLPLTPRFQQILKEGTRDVCPLPIVDETVEEIVLPPLAE